MIILVGIAYLLLAIFEFIPLYHQKLWRELLVVCCFYSLSLTIAVLLSLGVAIPSPEVPIRQLIASLLGK